MAKKKARFSEHAADSVSSFLQTVYAIRDAWNRESDDLIDPWFRGHASIEYVLVPWYLRDKRDRDDETEDDLRLDFQQKAVPLLDFAPPSSHWEWYFLMQHYGLPTRLLDWSESALVALWFAVSEHQGKVDAAVWMLDPWRLNKDSLHVDEVCLCTEKKVRKYLAKPHDPWTPPRKPAAIYPAHNFRRIAAQCGFFTIHGTAKPLEKNVTAHTTPMLARIAIPAKRAGTIRKDLRHAGITDATIFPDL